MRRILSNLIQTMIVLLVVTFLFTSCASNEESISQPVEPVEVSELDDNTLLLKDEDMYGSWKFIDDVYYITFTEENLFAIHFLREAKNTNIQQLNNLYAGKWEIVDGNELVLHATEKGFFNNKLQEVWEKIDSPIDFVFLPDSIESKDSYSFLGSSGDTIENLNIKKMLTEDEFAKSVDEILLDTFEDIYESEGNYKIEISSSSWSRRDTRFAQGDCKAIITDAINNISNEIEIDIRYELHEMQNIGDIEYLITSDKYDSVTLYANGKQTNKKPLVPVSSVGEQVKIGYITFTVNGVRESEGTGAFHKSEDKIYKIVDITLKNDGDKEIYIDPVWMFSIDKTTAFKYPQEAAGAKGNVEGKLKPGNEVRGEIAFEIENGKGLCLIFDLSKAGIEKRARVNLDLN